MTGSAVIGLAAVAFWIGYLIGHIDGYSRAWNKCLEAHKPFMKGILGEKQ